METRPPRKIAIEAKEVIKSIKDKTKELMENMVFMTDQELEENPSLLLLLEVALKAGANANTMMGDLPVLFYAIINNKLPLAKLLLDHNADPNWVEDKSGDSLLFTAGLWKRLDMISLLLQYGANPNNPTAKLGALLIELAAEFECDNIIRLTMEKGADVNLSTILELELKKGHLTGVTTLLKCDAVIPNPKVLADFLATRDQNNPDVQFCREILAKQQKAHEAKAMSQQLPKQLTKLEHAISLFQQQSKIPVFSIGGTQPADELIDLMSLQQLPDVSESTPKLR